MEQPGETFRKPQGSSRAVFPRYFINPRENKEIFLDFKQFFFRYSLKSSSTSKLALAPGLQLPVILKICLKVWGGIKR